MLAYILNEETKQLAVFPNGEPTKRMYEILNIKEYDVEQGYDGNFYVKGYAPILDIEKLKTEKLSEINTLYDYATSLLVLTYPQTEILTFDKQEQEAREWLADNNTDTPLLDSLSKGRDIEKSDLVNRIIKKADIFTEKVGYLTGLRQKYEDMLDKCETKEDIEKIIPTYDM